MEKVKRKKKIPVLSQEDLDKVVNANTTNVLIYKLNTWLSPEVRHNIKEKLWDCFEIENFMLKPVLSTDSLLKETNNKRIPFLLVQSDGTFLLCGEHKSRIKKILHNGKTRNLKEFFLDTLHEETLGVVFLRVE